MDPFLGAHRSGLLRLRKGSTGPAAGAASPRERCLLYTRLGGVQEPVRCDLVLIAARSDPGAPSPCRRPSNPCAPRTQTTDATFPRTASPCPGPGRHPPRAASGPGTPCPRQRPASGPSTTDGPHPPAGSRQHADVLPRGRSSPASRLSGTGSLPGAHPGTCPATAFPVGARGPRRAHEDRRGLQTPRSTGRRRRRGGDRRRRGPASARGPRARSPPGARPAGAAGRAARRRSGWASAPAA